VNTKRSILGPIKNLVIGTIVDHLIGDGDEGTEGDVTI
jgi:hypothetical protein